MSTLRLGACNDMNRLLWGDNAMEDLLLVSVACVTMFLLGIAQHRLELHMIESL